MTYLTQGGKYGGKREWEALKETYLDAPNPSTKTASIMGLCAVRDPELRKATLDFIMEGVRSQVCAASLFFICVLLSYLKDIVYFLFLGTSPGAGRVS